MTKRWASRPPGPADPSPAPAHSCLFQVPCSPPRPFGGTPKDRGRRRVWLGLSRGGGYRLAVIQHAVGRHDLDSMGPEGPALLQAGALFQGPVRGPAGGPSAVENCIRPPGRGGHQGPGGPFSAGRPENRGWSPEGGRGLPQTGGSLQRPGGSGCSREACLSVARGSEPPRCC